MSHGSVPKICPQCKQTDVTNFRKCRFCQTPYDAKIEEKASGVNQGIILIVSCLALLVIGSFALSAQNKQQKMAQLLPLAKSIKEANRPRMIEFYANWCGPCHTYGPIVGECQAKYQGKIDIVRLDVDAPASAELAKALEVGPIPKTFLFDKNGQEVEDFVGARSFDFLNEHLDKLLHLAEGLPVPDPNAK